MPALTACSTLTQMAVRERGSAFAVRSVVSLTSDAPASEIPKIADKTEEPWGDGSGGGGQQ